MVSANLISNFPVMIKYTNAAHKIFGPNVDSLKGKTARRQPEVMITDITAVPRKILQLNQWVTISSDIMFVNGLYFVMIIPQWIKFTTVEYVLQWTAGILSKSLDMINDIYNKRGF